MVFIPNLKAQISHGGIPRSFTLKSKLIEPELLVLSSPDVNKLRSEDLQISQKDQLYRYGISLPVNIGISDGGTWNILPNNDRIWQLEITSKDALALGIFFDSFELAEGSELFIYTPSRDQILGSFTSQNNSANNKLSIELLRGENLVLELFEPEKNYNTTQLNIQELVYAYRSVSFLPSLRSQEYNSSESCEVDINCSEGSDWQDEKRGIARISVKSHDGTYGWCTGSLVNNTRQDCFPYFLTAYHCAGSGITDSDLAAWVFYFNYERLQCNNSSETEPIPNTMSGAYFRAQSNNTTSSDFILLALASYVPENITPYFNGWKNQNATSTAGVGIHHPAGDIKKISNFTTTLSNYYNTHWAVTWATTTNGHGVTEGGSSGSPLFNNSSQIVGTLTGGLSACVTNGAGTGTGPNQSDIYGKFSYHWASAGTTPDKRLKDWLDTDNTGSTSLIGKNQDCAAFLPFVDFSADAVTVIAGTNIDFTNKTIVHPSYGTTYLWEFEGVDGTLTTVIKNPHRTYSTPGIFPVKLTATNTFGSSSKTIQITVNPNSITRIETTPVQCYPNPTTGKLLISSTIPNSTFNRVNVYNSLGQNVLSFELDKSSREIDIKFLPDGVYNIIFFGSENPVSQEIILRK